MSDRTSFYPELAKNIAPADGPLGVLLPGLGAVSTTLIAGVHLIRKGLARPFGSRDADAEAAPRQADRIRASRSIKDLVPLAGLDDLVFGGWDIFPDNAYEAGRQGGRARRRSCSRPSARSSRRSARGRPSSSARGSRTSTART